ncbi:Na-translocating system protein MpsC family protein [Saccharibacillus sp. JS10]|uniref:Na-translocating system protein MpsC family protein n=1 Tax=Saccharibacillus sp. JS10 TaxID=2950552 RepID=UPI00210AA7A7|nr:Na-translocating system protein MpsC family protein [Saccharibacillus sp. JS10]MCQ4086433.1 DUF2294 domain-containing protein [Saccharibacillus sp. JS10]
MNHPEIVAATTRHVGKMLRQSFGKGPEALDVFLDEVSIVITLKRFANPAEDALLARKDEKTFRYTRELLMKSLVPDLQTFFELELGLPHMSIFYDWNIDQASGVLVGLVQNDSQTKEVTQPYKGQEEVHAQIAALLGMVQRVPDVVRSWWVDPSTLLVFRKGLTILLEKELNEIGQADALKTAKRKLEKKLLWQEAKIGDALDRTLTELYIDWDFDRDDSVIVCRFK